MNPIFIYSIEDATKKKAGFFLAIDSAAEYDEETSYKIIGEAGSVFPMYEETFPRTLRGYFRAAEKEFDVEIEASDFEEILSGFSKLRAIAIMATKKTADGTIIRVEELRKLSSAQKKFLGIAQNKTEVEFIIQ